MSECNDLDKQQFLMEEKTLFKSAGSFFLAPVGQSLAPDKKEWLIMSMCVFYFI